MAANRRGGRLAKTVHVRMGDADYAALREESARAGMTQSEYLRHMARVPRERWEAGETVPTLDTKAMDGMRSELVNWGYHYNQAVHALNSAALYVRRGGGDAGYIAEQFEIANEKLEEVKKGGAEIAEALRQIAAAATVKGG